MKIEDTIYSYLSTHASLIAYVGTDIYPADMVPQDRAGPYIAHNIAYREKIYTHGGFSGVSIYSIQFSVYAATKDLAATIAGVLATVLEAWRTANPTEIGYAMQQDESDGWDDGKERYYYEQTYNIFYRE